jgi:hypothetical protein
VHLGYGTWIWLSVSKLTLKCDVVPLYSFVKQRLKCNTGKVCNCLIWFSWTSLPTPFINVYHKLYRPYRKYIYRQLYYPSTRHFKRKFCGRSSDLHETMERCDIQVHCGGYLGILRPLLRTGTPLP